MSEIIKILKFEDWLNSRNKNNNWITVAQSRKYHENGISYVFFTISIIADKSDMNNLLENYNWFSRVEFGNPGVWKDFAKKDRINYDPNNLIEKDGIHIQPFTIYRSWFRKDLESKFHIIEDFILFYNLYWDSKTHSFMTISETGEEYEVIKINLQKDNKCVDINTKFLRNYLAIKNKILIRQHEQTRFTSESLTSLIGKESEELEVKNKEYNFRLIMAEQPCSSYTSFSRLLGKDLILPYDEGKSLLEWEDNFEDFIIGVDEKGNNIHVTCDNEKLSNFFVNRGTSHFLTPVYFKKDVLKKYYDNPSKYSVSSSSVNCSSLWSIHIDEYKGLIQVWLGDFSYIPYNEQKHWKQYNVVSDGKITASRFKRDFMAEFCDPEDLMFRFNKEFDEFQMRFNVKFGFTLFIPLKHEDEYIYQTLRVPLNDEQPEFDSQLNSLAKILPDSIDITSIKQKLLQSRMKKEDMNDFKDKKIGCLDVFLQRNGIDRDIIQVLYVIQNIRSKCIAHRRGENCIQLLKSLGLNEKTNNEIFKILLNDLILSFKKTL